jgi:hypothetical protein
MWSKQSNGFLPTKQIEQQNGELKFSANFSELKRAIEGDQQSVDGGYK